MLLLFVALLLGMNVFVLMKFYKYKKESSLYIKYLQTQPDELNALKVNAEVMIQNSDTQLENVIVIDSMNEEKTLRSLFTNGRNKLLICRISDIYCESCVDYSIKRIMQWSDSIGKDNILFLGAYRNNKIFNRQNKLYGIDSFTTVNVLSLNLPAEELGFPYYFVLDSALTVFNVSIPDKSAPNIDYRYFQRIHEKFFSDNK